MRNLAMPLIPFAFPALPVIYLPGRLAAPDPARRSGRSLTG